MVNLKERNLTLSNKPNTSAIAEFDELTAIIRSWLEDGGDPILFIDMREHVAEMQKWQVDQSEPFSNRWERQMSSLAQSKLILESTQKILTGGKVGRDGILAVLRSIAELVVE